MYFFKVHLQYATCNVGFLKFIFVLKNQSVRGQALNIVKTWDDLI